MNLIGRYIFREAFGSWLVVMLVLFLIFMTNQLADILGDAAADRLPRDAVLAIFGLTALRYLTLLTPITLFLGVTLALARLNRDGEMAALSSCGIGLDAAARADRRVHVAARDRLDVARVGVDAGREPAHRRDSLQRRAERRARRRSRPASSSRRIPARPCSMRAKSSATSCAACSSQTQQGRPRHRDSGASAAGASSIP